MNTPSFRTLCGEWLNFVATIIPESTYERKGNYAILMATLELLGNLHGDWTREDCQIHMKSYVSQEGLKNLIILISELGLSYDIAHLSRIFRFF